jgi:hypothetical protein
MSKAMRDFNCQQIFESVSKSLGKFEEWSEEGTDTDVYWQNFTAETLSMIKGQYDLYSIKFDFF